MHKKIRLNGRNEKKKSHLSTITVFFLKIKIIKYA